ncbi:MAG: mandelate racemase/muconate lactonizing enzyme family protein [Firmicutes bacterium]|nr:mandelate racemase/muconate lactonizing enzyme family protein [Bacillota bacterium]
MKITGVKFYGLKYKLAQPLSFSLGTITHRNFALVKVETDEGIDGWGETFVNFPFWALEERRITVEKAVSPLLIGRDPLDPPATTKYLESMLYRLALQWGAKGPIYQAIAAVDIAMWDIKGKATGEPIYRLLGAEKPSPIPLYATGLDSSRIVDHALDCLAEGYLAVKVRVGFDERQDMDMVRTVCSAVRGAGRGKVYVDANQAWTREQALRLAPVVDHSGASWLEEPVPCDDIEGMAQIASSVRVPVAAGENYFTVDEFHRAVAAGALRVAMPDITRAGGFTGMREIAGTVRSQSIPCSPHHFGTDLGLAASLHLMTAVPAGLEMLRDVSNCSLKWEVIGEPLPVRNGQACAPDGPGLGVHVDEQAVARHLST